MAEEKKKTTKSTTKSASTSATKSNTTTRKKNTEEVKVEKKFCTNCGKELNEGETCNCISTKKSEGIVINTDSIINTCKSIWATILNIFKKPDTTITEEINNKESNKTVILTILLAITFAFYLMALVSNTVKNTVAGINNVTLGLGTISASSLDISYFKIFIYGVLIYGIMSFIPMLSTLIVAKITKNNEYSLKKAFKLYITSNAPLILGYLGMTLILLINVNLLNILGLIAFGIISVACFFNFILGFNKETTIREDRRSYALTSVLIIWIVIEVIALLIIVGSAFGDLYNKVSTPSNNTNYNDLFKW